MKLQTLSDRNLASYLRAKKHEITFNSRNAGFVDFSFPDTPQLVADIQAYNNNPMVPVLDFVSAQREINDALRIHRSGGVR